MIVMAPFLLLTLSPISEHFARAINVLAAIRDMYHALVLSTRVEHLQTTDPPIAQPRLVQPPIAPTCCRQPAR